MSWSLNSHSLVKWKAGEEGRDEGEVGEDVGQTAACTPYTSYRKIN